MLTILKNIKSLAREVVSEYGNTESVIYIERELMDRCKPFDTYIEEFSIFGISVESDLVLKYRDKLVFSFDSVKVRTLYKKWSLKIT